MKKKIVSLKSLSNAVEKIVQLSFISFGLRYQSNRKFSSLPNGSINQCGELSGVSADIIPRPLNVEALHIAQRAYFPIGLHGLDEVMRCRY